MLATTRPSTRRSPAVPSLSSDDLRPSLTASGAAARGRARCPVCGERFDARPAGVSCIRCRTPYHTDCWCYAERCSVFACDPVACGGAKKKPAPARRSFTQESPAEGITVSMRWAVTIALCLAVLSLPVVVPNIHATRERANFRACYANQKTLAGALEMYNLDKCTRVTKLDDAMCRVLQSGGYLPTVPQDPGDGTGGSSHYAWTPRGNGIVCSRHGSVP